VSLDETIVRIQSSPVFGDDESVGWREGQIVAERFCIVRCIGQGGMGKVYLARDESLDRLMALKRVPQEIVYDSDARDELREETNRLLDLAHENIIRVHTYYDEPTWPFFAMEYLEGPTLKALLRDRKHQGRCFEVEELTIIARQISKGLSYAHTKKLIHRDLKPANVMLARPVANVVDDTVVVKITDFGISRVVADSTLRQTGQRSGTLPYMSPEQFRGSECTVRSDVYSLGATYYELLSGRPPFYTGEIGHQIMNEEPRPIVGVSNEINEILSRALAKDPAARFANVEEFTTALDDRDPYPVRTPVPLVWKKVRKKLKMASVAALVLVFVFLSFDFVQRRVANRGSDESMVGTSSPPRVSGIEISELGRILQDQLDVCVADRVASPSFAFQLRREGPLQRERRVFHSIYFSLEKRGSEEEPREIRGSTVRGPDDEEDSRFLEFAVDGLDEGVYLLRPLLKAGVWPEAHAEQDLPAKLPAQKSFVVDLSGPDFVVQPLDETKFALVTSDLLATFGDTCELRLVAQDGPGDIDEAFFFYSIRPGEVGEPVQISDPGRWKIRLEAGQNHFRVLARDALGNPQEQVIQIDRLDFTMTDIKADLHEPHRGNTIEIEGNLRFADRYDPPELVFLVNSRRVHDLGEDYRVPFFRQSSFRARLNLPLHSNTVEVRYRLGDDDVPFVLPARISEIAVGAPEIAYKVPERTRETRVKIEGTLEPSFEGLVVSLDHVNVSRYALVVSPDPMDPGRARFDRDIHLVRNKLNKFKLTCAYDGEILPEAGKSFSIYCDTQAPDLPYGIVFESVGTRVRARMEPSEPLKMIRFRREGSSDWAPLMKDESEVYTISIPVPLRRTSFDVEMTDLVDNVATVSDVCELFLSDDDDDLTGGVSEVIPGLSKGTGRARPAGATVESECVLLRELGMKFLPFGSKQGRGMEMAETEVTLGVWNRFRAARGLARLPGDPKMPWSVRSAEFDKSLVDEFLRWLETSCDGDYHFFVPSAEEWLLAFTGALNGEEARKKILMWFSGYAKNGFRDIVAGNSRYGAETALPVGSRPINKTATQLLDMESNLQEIVHDDNGRWLVIGGHNALSSNELRDQFQRSELLTKPFSEDEGQITGLRVARLKKS
jgi:serine/threonine protein kinase